MRLSSHPLDGGFQPADQNACFPIEMNFDFAVTYNGLPARFVAQHGRKCTLWNMAHDARGGGIYRLADSWYPVTAGDYHLDGAVVPAVVRSDRQSASKIPHLQRLEPASTSPA